MKKIYLIIIMVMMIVSQSVDLTSALDSTQYLKLTLLSQTPDPAVAGQTVELRFSAENLGGAEINNLKFEFTPTYPFTKLDGEEYTKIISTLSGYQGSSSAIIFKFKVGIDKNVAEGTSQVKINESSPSFFTIEAFDVTITGKKFAQVIFIDKTVLIPGNQDTLKFIISNVGSAPLTDLTFSWVNEDKIVLPVGSDNTQYIKYIDVGESAELQYQVVADSNADAGLYGLDLHLTYDDPITGTEKEINTLAGIYVGGGTDFDIAFSESSSGSTSFTIANIGSNPAFSVSVIVPQQQGWTVSGSNSMIIGNLNKGDYTVASFALQSAQTRQVATTQQTSGEKTNATQQELMAQRANFQTSNILKIQIAYTNTMGKREVIEKDVSMNSQAVSGATTDTGTTGTQATTPAAMGNFRARGVVQQPSFFEKYKSYIVVLVVLILAGGAYWKYKKEKHLDPNFKFRDLFKIRNIFKKKSKSR